MDILNANIKFLRRQMGLTQQELADKLKIKRSSIGAYEEGRAKPNIDIQQSMAKVFGVRLDQLLTKKISKMSENAITQMKESSKEKANKLKVLSITVDPQNRENIELVPAKAAAGYLNGYADTEFIAELPRFQLPFLKGGTFRAFEISGDSMLPLQPGSIVVGEYVEDLKDIKDGQTYVVLSLQEGVVYKRVFNLIERENKLMLRSDNPSYSPFELYTEDILEVWQAKVFISQAVSRQDLSTQQMMDMLMSLQQEVKQLKSKQE